MNMPSKFLDLAEVVTRMGCNRTQFYKRPDLFPKPVRVGHKLKFLESEVEAKLQELAANSR